MCQLEGPHLISQAEWATGIAGQIFDLVQLGELPLDHGGNFHQGIGKRQAQKGANRRLKWEFSQILMTKVGINRHQQ
jgi:hypothetical protein